MTTQETYLLRMLRQEADAAEQRGEAMTVAPSIVLRLVYEVREWRELARDLLADPMLPYTAQEDIRAMLEDHSASSPRNATSAPPGSS